MKYFIKSLLLLSLFAILFSCNKRESDDDRNLVEFTGTITNTTNRTVANANVQLFVAGNSVAKYSTTTSNTGDYSFSQIEADNYTITVNNQGYNETTRTVHITETSSESMVLLGDAQVFGLIIDSQSGQGLANVLVSFTVNQSATTSENAELQVQTDSYGYYTITDGPTGEFIGLVEAVDYFPRTIESSSFIEGDNLFDPITCVKKPQEGELRVILSWGQNPSDLDSHLTGPNSGGSRFHVYFDNPIENYASLDVDDTSSFGPETITISNFYNGMYRYSIHNYSNQSNGGGQEIEYSPSLVEVYDFNGLVVSYTAPVFTGHGNTWRVFEINVSGATASINAINSYVQVAGSGDIDTFKHTTDKSKVKFDIRSF